MATKEEVLILLKTPPGAIWNGTLEVFVKAGTNGELLVSPNGKIWFEVKGDDIRALYTAADKKKEKLGH